jgi:hypothetical protein
MRRTIGVTNHLRFGELSDQMADGTRMVEVNVRQTDVVQVIHAQSGNRIPKLVCSRRRSHIYEINRVRPVKQPGPDKILKSPDGGSQRD